MNTKTEDISELKSIIDDLKEKVKLYRFDYLTGLKQRRDFDYDLRNKLKEHSFYLCYYDVNNLHKVNRQFGFAKGDQLIRQVASDIQHQAIPHTTYRTSGDELYTICCKEPTEDVDNATRVVVYTQQGANADDILKILDGLMIKEKAKLKDRRAEDE